jgi:hypothetical protein
MGSAGLESLCQILYRPPITMETAGAVSRGSSGLRATWYCRSNTAMSFSWSVESIEHLVTANSFDAEFPPTTVP